MKSTHRAPHIHVGRITLTALATACLGLMLSPARAAGPDPAYEPVAQLVQYGDLNLNTHEGIAQLYQRIETAASYVCGSDTRSLADWSHARTCAKASVSRAVAKIDNAALTALHTRKTGRLIKRRALLSKR